MGSITSGIGLVSGINSAQLIDNLIALEARGKTTLQQRIAALQTQRTALMDINARLLNLKNAAKSFRLDRIFQTALATSSHTDVLTATAGSGAQPGTYQFVVSQLVATSQQLSRGFADRSTSPLGLTSMSFEFGRGLVGNVDRPLEQLNGGNGIQRGKIQITDRSGAQATINLTDVTSLNEVLERINGTTTVSVTASVSADRLVLTDTSGGSGTLTVANVDGRTTATDLGIAGSAAGATLTGSVINAIGSSTALSILNDGNGVLVRNNVTDFTITARDGTLLSIDLGRINAPIANETLLSDLNNSLGVTISSDSENPDLRITDRDGTVHDVNLTGVTTVGGLISRISSETGGNVTLSVHADGKRFTLNDTTGGSGVLKVQGAGVNDEKTANDLGILKTAGVSADSFDGQIIPNSITNAPAASIGDVIARINSATGNNGKIVASIATDGVSLQINDTTGGGGNLIVRRTASNPHSAGALGIETASEGVAADSIAGNRLLASLGSVLVRNLNGGAGLNNASTLTINDRSGAEVTINGLDQFDSLADLVAYINQQTAAANVDVSVGLNGVGNGLQITDTSGGVGNLTISGDAADALGLAFDDASSIKRGSNLQHRYVSASSKLADLNYGRGIGKGVFRITDGLGASATIDIDSDSVTLHDVIDEINSRGLAIRARVNDTGDGLLVEADLESGQSPFQKIKIEAVSGTTGKDLNILGTSATIENASINGSYERTVSLAESDTLDRVVKKINDAGIPVTATVINSGSGATPFRVNFTSRLSGRAGELLIDSGDVDFGLTTLTKGQDAKVFFGGSSIENAFLVTSSTNSITGIIDGVTVNLLKTSETPVTLTVARDTVKMTDAVKQLVTTFNDAVGRINQYDFFNTETQQRGVLLGNPTTSRVREAMYRVLQTPAQGVTTQYTFLRQVGITIGAKGVVQFDQAKFEAAYENDPQAVDNLFAAYELTAAAGPQEITPGVTVQQTTPTVSVRGLGELFDQLLDGLTNSVNGVVTSAEKNFRDQIDLANRRISDIDIRLAAKRLRLQNQFAAMEAALAKFQNQGSSLASLAANVAANR